LRVLEIAGGRDDQVAPDVRLTEVAEQHVLRERRHRLGGAQDRPAERVIGPVLLGEELVNQIVGGVLDHLDLFEDHLLLALDLVEREGGMEHQVRQDVEGPRQVLVHHLDVVAGVFLRRERVEVAAHRVELLRDVLGGATFGALEEHVLDEVGDAALLGHLVPRAAGEPHTEAHRAHVRHGLGDEPDAVRKRVVDDHRGVGSRDARPAPPRVRETHIITVSGVGSRESGTWGTGCSRRACPTVRRVRQIPTSPATSPPNSVRHPSQ
jgi:hypothetical protein